LDEKVKGDGKIMARYRYRMRGKRQGKEIRWVQGRKGQ
jgi:hypothetical protein